MIAFDNKGQFVMAKEKVAEKAAKGKAKEVEKEAAAPEFKYGVADIADKLGIDASAVRVKLRNAGVDKAGKSYGWNTKSELNEVIEEISAKAEPKKAKTKEEAPKGKAKAKEAEKPAKKKKPKDEDDD